MKNSNQFEMPFDLQQQKQIEMQSNGTLSVGTMSAARKRLFAKKNEKFDPNSSFQSNVSSASSNMTQNVAKKTPLSLANSNKSHQSRTVNSQLTIKSASNRSKSNNDLTLYYEEHETNNQKIDDMDLKYKLMLDECEQFVNCDLKPGANNTKQTDFKKIKETKVVVDQSNSNSSNSSSSQLGVQIVNAHVDFYSSSMSSPFSSLSASNSPNSVCSTNSSNGQSRRQQQTVVSVKPNNIATIRLQQQQQQSRSRSMPHYDPMENSKESTVVGDFRDRR